jgi:hypothetical protein
MLDVLIFLLLLVPGQDLAGVLATVRRGVRIGDSNVKDGGRVATPGPSGTVVYMHTSRSSP